MFTFIIYKILLILSVFYNVNCVEDRSLDFPRESRHTDEYVDPHSLYYDKHSRTEKKIQEPYMRTETSGNVLAFTKTKCQRIIDDCIQNHANDIPDALFARRLVNIMLTRAKFDEDDDLITGSISLELTVEDMTRLRNFGLGKSTVREIDPIISNIFRQPEKNTFTDIFAILKAILLNIVIHKEITVTIITILYIAWLVLRTHWNVLKLMFIILILIFAASFIITWLQLIREAEIKLTVKQMLHTKLPDHCRPSQMSWWDQMWSMFKSKEDCYRYFEARMENPFLAVTPGQALTHMIGTCILQPAGLLGKAINDFVDNVTKHMWYPVRVIMGSAIILVIIFAVVVMMICMAGGSLNWGFGPFSIFSIGKLQKSCQGGCLNEKNRKPVEVILNLKVEHKGEIQNMRVDCVEQSSTKSDDTETKPVVNKIQLALEKTALTDCDPAGGDANSPSTSTDREPVKTSIKKVKIPTVNSGGGDN